MINSPVGFKEDPINFPGDPYPKDENGNILFSDVFFKKYISIFILVIIS
jgi:hypothetical protein